MLRESQRSAAPDASRSCMDRFHAGHYERDAKSMRTNREQLQYHRLPLSKRYVRTKQLALKLNAKLMPYLGDSLWSQKDGIKPIYKLLNAYKVAKRKLKGRLSILHIYSKSPALRTNGVNGYLMRMVGCLKEKV